MTAPKLEHHQRNPVVPRQVGGSCVENLVFIQAWLGIYSRQAGISTAHHLNTTQELLCSNDNSGFSNGNQSELALPLQSVVCLLWLPYLLVAGLIASVDWIRLTVMAFGSRWNPA